jgi:hypothetical protein
MKPNGFNRHALNFEWNHKRMSQKYWKTEALIPIIATLTANVVFPVVDSEFSIPLWRWRTILVLRSVGTKQKRKSVAAGGNYPVNMNSHRSSEAEAMAPMYDGDSALLPPAGGKRKQWSRRFTR